MSTSSTLMISTLAICVLSSIPTHVMAEGDARDNQSTGALVWKFFSMAGVFGVSILFSLLPVCFARFLNNTKLIDIVNAFTGGVFLATAMMHILPESVEEWESSPHSGSYPWPFFMCLVGYFFVLFIERIAFSGSGGDGHGHGHGGPKHDDGADRVSLLDSRIESSSSPSQSQSQSSSAQQARVRGSSGPRPSMTIQQQYQLPTIFDTRAIAVSVTQRDGSKSIYGAPRAVLAFQIGAEDAEENDDTPSYQAPKVPTMPPKPPLRSAGVPVAAAPPPTELPTRASSTGSDGSGATGGDDFDFPTDYVPPAAAQPPRNVENHELKVSLLGAPSDAVVADYDSRKRSAAVSVQSKAPPTFDILGMGTGNDHHQHQIGITVTDSSPTNANDNGAASQQPPVSTVATEATVHGADMIGSGTLPQVEIGDVAIGSATARLSMGSVDFDSRPISRPAARSTIAAAILPPHVNSCAPFILFMVLSIQSFVEGIVIGIQDTTRGVITLSTAILMHKWVESALMTINLMQGRAKRRRLVFFAVVYSLLTPLGTLLGLILESFISVTTQSLINAFCVGTFVYVGASEVIVESFASQGQVKVKFFALLFGAALLSIAVIAG